MTTGKYLFDMRFATPANIDVALSVTGDDLDTMIQDAIQAYNRFKTALWDATTNDNTMAQAQANDKAGVGLEAQATPTKAQATPTKAQAPAKANNEVPVCPEHGISRQGRNGRFCPTRVNEDPDGHAIYCDWTAN